MAASPRNTQDMPTPLAARNKVANVSNRNTRTMSRSPSARTVPIVRGKLPPASSGVGIGPVCIAQAEPDH